MSLAWGQGWGGGMYSEVSSLVGALMSLDIEVQYIMGNGYMRPPMVLEAIGEAQCIKGNGHMGTPRG